ncbi:MAG: ATP-binding cassette domain-containing protein [Deltaproteobacteria bacterium]|nr:ATP-binding cassette domain-containing protein [Deltaproteobacteria bacterium]
MIHVENLVKRYRDRVAVDHLSFKVEEGQILGFLGPNGAGKSTTMRILTGFLPASGGTVKVAGLDVFEKPLEVKRQVGYLPELPPLYVDMTVSAYLKFVARLKGVEGKRLKGEVERVAHLTSVTDVLDRVIANISKGYKQRVGMAQALLNDPKVLILDEPTVGLDPKQIHEVRDLIKSLAGKHTIVLSTHIMQEVSATCQKVLIINQGKLVAYDDLTELTQKHRVESREPSLEEVFIKLTAA